MKSYIKKFSEIELKDIPEVGGKNASLGEMFSKLGTMGITVPDGFSTTAAAFDEFLTLNALHKPLAGLLENLDRKSFSNLDTIAEEARKLMLAADLPADFCSAVKQAYKVLAGNQPLAVAVRSSATAEDLPQMSFAGQHETFLNVSGEEAVLEAVKKCFASLFTERAIKYREDNNVPHLKIALCVGVQAMVRSDKACSGLVFTLDPESGFKDVIHISGVWGLGENIVQGAVIPDEFLVFKPTLIQDKNALIQKKLGQKSKMMVYGYEGSATIVNMPAPVEKQEQFVLNNDEIIQLARWSLTIEKHYNRPMDIEWAKDGFTKQIYIVQARPETVHSQRNPMVVKEYRLLSKREPIVTGEAIGMKVATGNARILHSVEEAASLQPGEIIVTEITSPDWDPVLKKAAAIITDKGGRTSHASIVARELGVPAIVGCGNATQKIINGEMITLSCCEGRTGNIYRGKINYVINEVDYSSIRKPDYTDVMLIAEDPENAFHLSFYPNDGVGLMRMEFIISHNIGIHPMALINFRELKDKAVKDKIEKLTHGYTEKENFFTDKLAEGIATIAAAFYPKDVIVRMSDFKTNEYANLLGGKAFEPVEQNPMIGFRGASRYYNNLYREGFRLECQAIRKVRNEMGLENVKVMIPFCRTLAEGNKVLAVMKTYGLEQGVNGLEVYVMAEIPSNVLLAGKFAKMFDGFSIGSNDLTQLTLGIDRDSAIISDLFDEQNEAVKDMISAMILEAKNAGVRIGLCGQAPSDFPEFARFLVEQGIDSISFTPDAILSGIENIKKAESNTMVLA